MKRRYLRVALLGTATASLLLAMPTQVLADTINATLGAQYFQVAANSGDPDFGIYNTPVVANGSSLGPNGMPVASSGVNDIDSTTNEITWWSPTLNSNVVAQTGCAGTVSLPYASNMYVPCSTGSNDSTYYETAIFTGLFNLASSGTVQFQLGSDDDSFIYVDGVLFGQNPGVHGVTNVNFTTPTLDAGSHTLQVFFADRHWTGAYLSLNLLSTGVIITPPVTVPEPGTLALLGLGLAGLGLARRRKQD